MRSYAEEVIDTGVHKLASFTQPTQADYIAAAPDAVTAGVGMSAAFAKQTISESMGAIEMAHEGMKQFGAGPDAPSPKPDLLRTALGVAIDTIATGGAYTFVAAGLPQFAGALNFANNAGHVMNGGRLANAALGEMSEPTQFMDFDEEEAFSFAGSVDPLEGGLHATMSGTAPLMPQPAHYEPPAKIWLGDDMPPELEALHRQERAHNEHIADVNHAVQLPPAPAFA